VLRKVKAAAAAVKGAGAEALETGACPGGNMAEVVKNRPPQRNSVWLIEFYSPVLTFFLVFYSIQL
jgi:hypothetical protein